METFHYDDDQWREMVKHVKDAGGSEENLKARRRDLEKIIDVGKRRLDKKRLADDKKRIAHDKASTCEKIKAESAKLRAVLSNLTTLMRDDPVWEPLAEKLAKINPALDHIDRLAEQRGRREDRRRGRPESKDRDLLFKRVGQFWEEDLGREWTRSESPMTRFIAAACRDVCPATSSAVSQALMGGRKDDLEWAAKVTIGGVKITAKNK